MEKQTRRSRRRASGSAQGPIYISVSIDGTLRDLVDLACEVEDRSMASFIRVALRTTATEVLNGLDIDFPPPRPAVKSRNISLQVPDELKMQVDQAVASRNATLMSFFRVSLERAATAVLGEEEAAKVLAS